MSNSTTSQLRLRPSVLRAKQLLAEVREKLHRQHAAGTPGIQVCNLMTDLLDSVVLEVYRSALADLGEEREGGLRDSVSLVAHGGYGRRDAAPFSDIDVMLLCEPAAAGRVPPLARRLLADLGDTRLQVGFSVRTPAEACRLSRSDATICTTLAEARYLAGSEQLLERFKARFRRQTRRHWRSLVTQIESARRGERRQFGETVYLLEPNIKRSRGALRDLQLIRWIGFARYGEREFDSLVRLGVLPPSDRATLRKAQEFLLRLRNEMHFHAGRTYDVLFRHDQQRIAELYGYQGEEGLLPVEQFMRDYFTHTGGVRNVVANFLAGARPRTVAAIVEPLVSRSEGRRYRVGPVHIRATREGLRKLKGNLEEVLRLMSLANHSQTRIEHATWEAIREDMLDRPVEELTPEAAAKFLDLLGQPGRLGELLRRLHELRVLEKIIPGMAHARCLLQFNQYHKYTVDEHCLRAVEAATELLHDEGVAGSVYRSLRQKRTLHLALLLHDLGKGYPEDHSEVGARLAEETAARLGLPQREADTLRFLVLKHLSMFHLATRRDPSDEAQVVRFAVEVGAPDVLQLLYLLTCADLAAVGPGVLNSWKQEMLTDLYHHAMQHLAGDAPSRYSSGRLRERRDQVRALIPPDEQGEESTRWWETQIAALTPAYLSAQEPAQVIEELSRLRRLTSREATAWGRYLPEREVVEYTIGTNEAAAPGIFHRLTGALSRERLRILSADIDTLAEGLVLDRFYVHDLDFAGPPPRERLEAVCRSLVQALKQEGGVPLDFRNRRNLHAAQEGSLLEHLPTRVSIDNDTSERNTVIDVFAHDRLGLLYTITRTLFELELSITAARIGTYLDQVVDVFFVTDRDGEKITEERRLVEIRERLLEAIERHRTGE